MAETQVDGGSDEGTATNANGGASQNQSVQQPSFDAAKLQESLDALNDGFKTLEARVNGLQSVKDKDKQELSGLKAKIAEYEQLKERFGEDGALEQIEMRDTLQRMNETLQKLQGSTSTPSPGTGASGAGTLAQVIRDNKLDANDPAVAKILAENQGNDLNAAVQLGRLASATRQADPSASTSMTGGNSPSSNEFSEMSSDEIGAELTNLTVNNFRGSAERRAALQAELDRRDKQRR